MKEHGVTDPGPQFRWVCAEQPPRAGRHVVRVQSAELELRAPLRGVTTTVKYKHSTQDLLPSNAENFSGFS